MSINTMTTDELHAYLLGRPGCSDALRAVAHALKSHLVCGEQFLQLTENEMSVVAPSIGMKFALQKELQAVRTSYSSIATAPSPALLHGATVTPSPHAVHAALAVASGDVPSIAAYNRELAPKAAAAQIGTTGRVSCTPSSIESPLVARMLSGALAAELLVNMDLMAPALGGLCRAVHFFVGYSPGAWEAANKAIADLQKPTASATRLEVLEEAWWLAVRKLPLFSIGLLTVPDMIMQTTASRTEWSRSPAPWSAVFELPADEQLWGKSVNSRVIQRSNVGMHDMYQPPNFLSWSSEWLAKIVYVKLPRRLFGALFADGDSTGSGITSAGLIRAFLARRAQKLRSTTPAFDAVGVRRVESDGTPLPWTPLDIAPAAVEDLGSDYVELLGGPSVGLRVASDLSIALHGFLEARNIAIAPRDRLPSGMLSLVDYRRHMKTISRLGRGLHDLLTSWSDALNVGATDQNLAAVHSGVRDTLMKEAVAAHTAAQQAIAVANRAEAVLHQAEAVLERNRDVQSLLAATSSLSVHCSYVLIAPSLRSARGFTPEALRALALLPIAAVWDFDTETSSEGGLFKELESGTLLLHGAPPTEAAYLQLGDLTARSIQQLQAAAATGGLRVHVQLDASAAVVGQQRIAYIQCARSAARSLCAILGASSQSVVILYLGMGDHALISNEGAVPNMRVLMEALLDNLVTSAVGLNVSIVHITDSPKVFDHGEEFLEGRQRVLCRDTEAQPPYGPVTRAFLLLSDLAAVLQQRTSCTTNTAGAATALLVPARFSESGVADFSRGRPDDELRALDAAHLRLMHRDWAGAPLTDEREELQLAQESLAMGGVEPDPRLFATIGGLCEVHSQELRRKITDAICSAHHAATRTAPPKPRVVYISHRPSAGASTLLRELLHELRFNYAVVELRTVPERQQERDRQRAVIARLASHTGSPPIVFADCITADLLRSFREEAEAASNVAFVLVSLESDGALPTVSGGLFVNGVAPRQALAAEADLFIDYPGQTAAAALKRWRDGVLTRWYDRMRVTARRVALKGVAPPAQAEAVRLLHADVHYGSTVDTRHVSLSDDGPPGVSGEAMAAASDAAAAVEAASGWERTFGINFLIAASQEVGGGEGARAIERLWDYWSSRIRGALRRLLEAEGHPERAAASRALHALRIVALVAVFAPRRLLPAGWLSRYILRGTDGTATEAPSSGSLPARVDAALERLELLLPERHRSATVSIAEAIARAVRTNRQRAGGERSTADIGQGRGSLIAIQHEQGADSVSLLMQQQHASMSNESLPAPGFGKSAFALLVDALRTVPGGDEVANIIVQLPSGNLCVAHRMLAQMLLGELLARNEVRGAAVDADVRRSSLASWPPTGLAWLTLDFMLNWLCGEGSLAGGGADGVGGELLNDLLYFRPQLYTAGGDGGRERAPFSLLVDLVMRTLDPPRLDNTRRHVVSAAQATAMGAITDATAATAVGVPASPTESAMLLGKILDTRLGSAGLLRLPQLRSHAGALLLLSFEHARPNDAHAAIHLLRFALITAHRDTEEWMPAADSSTGVHAALPQHRALLSTEQMRVQSWIDPLLDKRWEEWSGIAVLADELRARLDAVPESDSVRRARCWDQLGMFWSVLLDWYATHAAAIYAAGVHTQRMVHLATPSDGGGVLVAEHVCPADPPPGGGRKPLSSTEFITALRAAPPSTTHGLLARLHALYSRAQIATKHERIEDPSSLYVYRNGAKASLALLRHTLEAAALTNGMPCVTSSPRGSSVNARSADLAWLCRLRESADGAAMLDRIDPLELELDVRRAVAEGLECVSRASGSAGNRVHLSGAVSASELDLRDVRLKLSRLQGTSELSVVAAELAARVKEDVASAPARLLANAAVVCVEALFFHDQRQHLSDGETTLDMWAEHAAWQRIKSATDRRHQLKEAAEWLTRAASPPLCYVFDFTMRTLLSLHSCLGGAGAALGDSHSSRVHALLRSWFDDGSEPARYAFATAAFLRMLAWTLHVGACTSVGRTPTSDALVTARHIVAEWSKAKDALNVRERSPRPLRDQRLFRDVLRADERGALGAVDGRWVEPSLSLLRRVSGGPDPSLRDMLLLVLRVDFVDAKGGAGGDAALACRGRASLSNDLDCYFSTSSAYERGARGLREALLPSERDFDVYFGLLQPGHLVIAWIGFNELGARANVVCRVAGPAVGAYRGQSLSAHVATEICRMIDKVAIGLETRPTRVARGATAALVEPQRPVVIISPSAPAPGVRPTAPHIAVTATVPLPGRNELIQPSANAWQQGPPSIPSIMKPRGSAPVQRPAPALATSSAASSVPFRAPHTRPQTAPQPGGHVVEAITRGGRAARGAPRGASSHAAASSRTRQM